MSGQPFGYGLYEPPASQRARPAVITWFRVYAATMVMMYVGFLALWMFLTPNAPTYREQAATELGVLLTLILIGLLFGGFYCVAALVPYRPWGWTVGLIAICLGLSSCTVVFAIPLLMYWMKAETKAAFGRL